MAAIKPIHCTPDLSLEDAFRPRPSKRITPSARLDIDGILLQDNSARCFPPPPFFNIVPHATSQTSPLSIRATSKRVFYHWLRSNLRFASDRAKCRSASSYPAIPRRPMAGGDAGAKRSGFHQRPTAYIAHAAEGWRPYPGGRCHIHLAGTKSARCAIQPMERIAAHLSGCHDHHERHFCMVQFQQYPDAACPADPNHHHLARIGNFGPRSRP